MRLASYVVLSATCRVTAVTYISVYHMVRMINRHGEQNEVALEQHVPPFSLRSFSLSHHHDHNVGDDMTHVHIVTVVSYSR